MCYKFFFNQVCNAVTEWPFSFLLVHFGSISDRIQGPFSATVRMPLILFWAEVEEEEEDDDENSVFLGLMKMEEEEEESLFSGLMKMESDKEE